MKNEYLIDRINEDIVGTIQLDVSLKKSGNGWIGLCPFHGEKTPSFRVHEAKNTFKCFGCGVGGDAISFVQKLHGLSFFDTLRRIGKDKGIEVEEQKVTNYNHEQAEAMMTLKRYQDLLLQGNTSYAISRGLTNETIKTFGIGLHTSIVSGFSNQDLSKAGLTSDNGYELMKNRLTFAFHNRYEQVIGFGGREMGNGKIKYINNSNTVVYDKSKFLYNYYRAMPFIKDEDCVVVVEGYFDVTTLWQFGIQNVVGTCGTAFTEDQCAMLVKAGAKTIVFSFDADNAGLSALKRGIAVCNKVGVMPKFVLLKKDPDDTIKEIGTQRFKELLSNAKTWHEDRVLKYKKSDSNTQKELLLECKDTIFFCKNPEYRIFLLDFFSTSFDVPKTYFDQQYVQKFEYKKRIINLDFEKKFVKMISSLVDIASDGVSVIAIFANEVTEKDLECFSEEFCKLIERFKVNDLSLLPKNDQVVCEPQEAYDQIMKTYQKHCLICLKQQIMSEDISIEEKTKKVAKINIYINERN